MQPYAPALKLRPLRPRYTKSSPPGRPMRQISVAQLFEARREALALNHVCGALERVIMVSEPELWPADLAAHPTRIHPNRTQLFANPDLPGGRPHPQERPSSHLEDAPTPPPPPTSAPTVGNLP